MAEHWILKCTEKSKHDTEVKLQINIWTGTLEFSDTVFHHANLRCKKTRKIKSSSSVLVSFKLVLCSVILKLGP